MNARPPSARRGVRLVGTGRCLPEKTLSNAQLERMMDTSDEWIVQRTGIRMRHVVDRDRGESTLGLASEALRRALADASIDPLDLDLLVLATMTSEMMCPPTACRVVHAAGATRAAAFDLNGACSGFVFSLNVAHELVRGGAYRTVAVVGADTLSVHMDYCTAGRGTAILFGDGAGAVILRATDDATKGLLAHSMHTDGTGWMEIYIPYHPTDFPEGTPPDPSRFGHVQMNGSSVFKFAVSTFPQLIQETLDKAGLTADDVDMFVCHQSNRRILDAARARFGLPEDKLYVNIDRVGNTVAASVPMCLDELRRAGRVREGMKVMFVAFGGGLTWGSSLWQL
ncbi:MAG: ketoacyl-ACP synthase III [Phycisphaerae bacterium]|nr:ketoacyl-ACP synthase III [Phycisphaerae bacterium]